MPILIPLPIPFRILTNRILTNHILLPHILLHHILFTTFSFPTFSFPTFSFTTFSFTTFSFPTFSFTTFSSPHSPSPHSPSPHSPSPHSPSPRRPSDHRSIAAAKAVAQLLGQAARATSLLRSLISVSPPHLSSFPPRSIGVAKAVAQLLGRSYDEVLLSIKKIPFLQDKPHARHQGLLARHLMDRHVAQLREMETPSLVRAALIGCLSPALMVVDAEGGLKGVVSRTRLLALLAAHNHTCDAAAAAAAAATAAGAAASGAAAAGGGSDGGAGVGDRRDSPRAAAAAAGPAGPTGAAGGGGGSLARLGRMAGLRFSGVMKRVPWTRKARVGTEEGGDARMEEGRRAGGMEEAKGEGKDEEDDGEEREEEEEEEEEEGESHEWETEAQRRVRRERRRGHRYTEELAQKLLTCHDDSETGEERRMREMVRREGEERLLDRTLLAMETNARLADQQWAAEDALWAAAPSLHSAPAVAATAGAAGSGAVGGAAAAGGAAGSAAGSSQRDGVGKVEHAFSTDVHGHGHGHGQLAVAPAGSADGRSWQIPSTGSHSPLPPRPPSLVSTPPAPVPAVVAAAAAAAAVAAPDAPSNAAASDAASDACATSMQQQQQQQQHQQKQLEEGARKSFEVEGGSEETSNARERVEKEEGVGGAECSRGAVGAVVGGGEAEVLLDVTAIMDPFPFHVPLCMPILRVFPLMRKLNLTYVCVVDSTGQPAGLITRAHLIDAKPVHASVTTWGHFGLPSFRLSRRFSSSRPSVASLTPEATQAARDRAARILAALDPDALAMGDTVQQQAEATERVNLASMLAAMDSVRHLYLQPGPEHDAGRMEGHGEGMNGQEGSGVEGGVDGEEGGRGSERGERERGERRGAREGQRRWAGRVSPRERWRKAVRLVLESLRAQAAAAALAAAARSQRNLALLPAASAGGGVGGGASREASGVAGRGRDGGAVRVREAGGGGGSEHKGGKGVKGEGMEGEGKAGEEGRGASVRHVHWGGEEGMRGGVGQTLGDDGGEEGAAGDMLVVREDAGEGEEEREQE
ncbi:unnamed protein product [Closterium sp. Naga37s-1]|nr:unnamed protein product [Closterium sp. Naga37s-1]